jgi:hypothetical protein
MNQCNLFTIILVHHAWVLLMKNSCRVITDEVSCDNLTSMGSLSRSFAWLLCHMLRP